MGEKEIVYDLLGGEAAMDAAVNIFYRKVLADSRISQFFEGADIDMDKQIAKQKAFLTMVFGGPNNYTGKDMRTAHAHLVAKGLNDRHFDAVLDDLQSTLQELKVPGYLVAHVINVAESVRNDVLNR